MRAAILPAGRRSRPHLALAVVIAAVALGCAPDRTMLVVRIDSDIAVPAAMNNVRLVVMHAGKTLQDLPFSLKPGNDKLPLQVGLLSPSGGGDDVEINVSGFLEKTFVVGQSAITSFIRGKSLVLDIFLSADCVNFVCPEPDQTCTRGQVCIPKTVPASSLRGFDPNPPRAVGADAAGGVAVPDAGADAAGGAAGAAGSTGGAGATGGGAGGVVVEPPLDAPLDRPVEAAPEVKPGCVPKPEDCYNGLDDDCDGLNDCADPDCATITLCVPRPSGQVGTQMPLTVDCPQGFAAPTSHPTPYGLTVDPGGTGCAGCQCAQATSTTSCAATITTYLSTADCQAGTNGKNVLTLSSTSADACPVPDTSTANVFGAALSAWTVTSTACGATGTPVKPTAAFATSTGFCHAANLAPTTLDSGCAAGSVCMRRPPAGDPVCVLLADASACPAGTKQTAIVYEGVTDNRSCAACTCAVQGASCDNLVVQMGSDYGCGIDTADLHGGARTCTTTQPTSGVYVPGYHLAGTPTNGTCTPASALAGAVTPTGAHAICCLP